MWQRSELLRLRVRIYYVLRLRYYHVSASEHDDVHDVSGDAERADDNADIAMYRLIPLRELHQLTLCRHRQIVAASRRHDALIHRHSWRCHVHRVEAEDVHVDVTLQRLLVKGY